MIKKENNFLWSFSKSNVNIMLYILGIIFFFNIFSFVNIWKNIRYLQLENSIKKIQREKRKKLLEINKLKKQISEENSIENMNHLYEERQKKIKHENSKIVRMRVPSNYPN